MGILSIFLALIGLGFLIFIHELGHYLVARLSGIRVEAFSIGMGRPIYYFLHKGVKVQLGWIPFGGYVKMAGETTEDREDPEGFFAQSPWKRILVAFFGPLANILFALLAFFIIWTAGGREKAYSDITSRVGWVDPSSELYAKGVRPGDRIVSYNGKPLSDARDHVSAAMTAGSSLQVEVEKLRNRQDNLVFEIAPYQHPLVVDKGWMTTGVLSPASFLICNPPQGETGLSGATQKIGIQESDRLVWLDGEPLFSQMQLGSLLNDGCQLVTVIRSGKVLHLHIPRLHIDELKLAPEIRGEISDWKYESGLHSSRLNQDYFMPYNISSEGVVEGKIPLLDPVEATKGALRSPIEDVLLQGDRITAVGGKRVFSAPEILQAFQEKRVMVIVERAEKQRSQLDVTAADQLFSSLYDSDQLSDLIDSIGTDQQKEKSGSLVLLNPIVPKTFSELFSEIGRTREMVAVQEKEREALERIEDPESRKAAEESLLARDRQLYLGLFGFHDAPVLHNPSPLAMCWSILDQMKQTLSALFGGYLSPKWMVGPIGIVHVMHQQWSMGYKEALFWLGFISLNLAFLNLLPFPALDGGHILLSLIEMVTGVKLRPQTLEKIILPFVILLIGFLIYITYHDIMRIFSNFFS